MRRFAAVLVLAALVPLVPLTTPSSAFATTVATCSYRQLEVAVAWGPGAAAGNVGIPFLIANISKTTCTLEGYPRLTFTPDAYRGRSIKVRHNVGMIFGFVKPRLVTIKPGEDASFGINFGDAANQSDPNGGPCLVRNIYVTMPVRTNTYDQNFETTVNFNFCFTDFVVGETAIQAGPLPKEG